LQFSRTLANAGPSFGVTVTGLVKLRVEGVQLPVSRWADKLDSEDIERRSTFDPVVN